MPQDPKTESIGPGPSMFLPMQDLPANIPKGGGGYRSGPDLMDTGSGRIVAYAIRVRADLKVGDREFSGEISLHEYAPFRRFYEELNGNVRLEPGWPPGLSRLVPLTQEQLSVELNRMKVAFIVPRTNSVLEILPLFLGAEPAGQLTRLHDLMRRQMEAWAKLVEIAKKRIPEKVRPTDPERLLALACDHITARELEEIAAMGDPSRDGVGSIELPEVLAPAPMRVNGGSVDDVLAPKSLEEIEAEVNAEKVEDPQLELIAKLKKEGLDETQAASIASLIELSGGAALSDEDILSTVGNKTKVAAVKRALKG